MPVVSNNMVGLVLARGCEKEIEFLLIKLESVKIRFSAHWWYTIGRYLDIFSPKNYNKIKKIYKWFSCMS